MSCIQLPYGFVKNNKHIQFNLPKITKSLNILKDFLILQLRTQLMIMWF